MGAGTHCQKEGRKGNDCVQDGLVKNEEQVHHVVKSDKRPEPEDSRTEKKLSEATKKTDKRKHKESQIKLKRKKEQARGDAWGRLSTQPKKRKKQAQSIKEGTLARKILSRKPCRGNNCPEVTLGKNQRITTDSKRATFKSGGSPRPIQKKVRRRRERPNWRGGTRCSMEGLYAGSG